ncbi:MAG: HD domain-containing protein [Nitrosomonadales bacterium]
MNTKSTPTTAEVTSLFSNNEPDEVWAKAASVAKRINPDFDPVLAKSVFDDVVRMFRGDYPGYCSIKTLYHNLPHTLDVFLCAMRLLHGVHVMGTRITDDEINMVVIATLMHDIGYAQEIGEDTGTGAQFTESHVRRGVEFMRHYVAERNFPSGYADTLEPIILTTDPALAFSELVFPSERARLLGKVVGTADLTGQMADRTYLEKLLFLYLEFKEAHYGHFQSVNDMLRQTEKFYNNTRKKLDDELDGMYAQLTFHFMDTLGVENNFYLESIEKNIGYLSKVVALNEEDYFTMLKRGGIVEQAQSLKIPD